MKKDGAKLAEHTIWIDASPECVFELLSSSAQIRSWLWGGDLRVGGAGSQDRQGAGGEDSTLDILESIPGKRVALAWYSPSMFRTALPASLVEIELLSERGGTLVRLTHSQLPQAAQFDPREALARLQSLAGVLERVLCSHLPAPPLVERMVANFLFLDPKFGEGRIAYAWRRTAASIVVCLLVGLIAIVNLATVGRTASIMHTESWLVPSAIALILANVFAHTVIGLGIDRAGLLRQILGCVCTSAGVVASCLAFFWLATGQVEAGNGRLAEWLWTAATAQVFMLAYASWFTAESLRRRLDRPSTWKTRRGFFGSLPLLLAILFWDLATSAALAQGPDVVATIDALMAKKYPADEPGAAVLVAKNGEVLVSRGYGLSNLEHGTPITGDTPFCIASVTKPFTAMATLMLVEQGKLRLEDRLADLLPEYPAHASEVSVKHLLSHTSGIKDVSRLPQWRSDMRSDLTVPQILEHFQSLPLAFPPGDKWEYSNSGYLLLGAILEKVTDKSYAQLIQEEIFAKAGMRNSYFGSRQQLIPHRADGYGRDKSGYVNAEYVSMTRPYAAGALICSVNDLNVWSSALMLGKLLKKETVDAAFAPVTLNSGEPTVCGLGWMIGTYHGHRVVQHSGGMPGFSAQMWLLPDDNMFTVLLSNSPDKTDQKLIGSIVATALGEAAQDRPKTVRLDELSLRKYSGRYQLTAFGMDVVTVRYESGKLTMHVPPNPVCELHATAPDKFYVTEEDIQVTFVLDRNGNDPGLILHHGGLDLRAHRMTE